MRALLGSAVVAATVVGSVVLVGATSAARAGAEFPVNTETGAAQIDATIGSFSDGRFVVAWRSDGAQDGDDSGIFAQRFKANGARAGGEFRVNTTTANNQQAPSLAVLADASFVVVYTDSAGPVRGQRFSTKGKRVGKEFAITVVGGGRDTAIAALPNGGWVVVYVGLDDNLLGVFAQVYSNTGQKVKNVRVNQTQTGDQQRPAVAANDNGFMVVWDTPNQDGSELGIYARRFDAGGNALGDEFLVNTTTTGFQFTPRIATLTDGTMVAVWVNINAMGERDVFAQRYAADGTPLGDEFMVNAVTGDFQIQDRPDVSARGTGFVVVYEATGVDGNNFAIVAQRFRANGKKLGGETQVNQDVVGAQVKAVVAPLLDNDFAVAWESLDTPSTFGIFGRKLN